MKKVFIQILHLNKYFLIKKEKEINYQIIYDTLNDTYSFSNNLTYMSILFLILIIGSVGIMLDKDKKNQEFSLAIVAFIIFCFLMMLLFINNNFLGYTQYANLVKKIEQNQYSVIEGKIKNFKPISKYDKAEEEFFVKDILFRYSPHKNLKVFSSVKGQNKQGNPLEENLSVRVTYYFDKNWNTNLILKLEINKR